MTQSVLTDYHAKYFAHELTKRCSSDSVEKLASVVANAQVDLNPHQVDAALFAFNSPLSKGALLADEVGLGKTIEAGLVVSQKWAERNRRLLVITPASLRKQWHQELTEKFFLPCQILETKSYNDAVRGGSLRPLETPEAIVICSFQFARSKAADVANAAWDLVVIDEAHHLRNVYKPSNVIANTLKRALAGKNKLLLTATPLQNSLDELFGLVSFIDEHTFGNLQSFREQFAGLARDRVVRTLAPRVHKFPEGHRFAALNTFVDEMRRDERRTKDRVILQFLQFSRDDGKWELRREEALQRLKARIEPICHRTLRRQVSAYISFTRRLSILEEFTPEESEDRLYNLVSDYLRRDDLHALPASQRSLMTLVLRKLLASSTFAIAGALETISNRLKAKLQSAEPAEPLEDELDQDYEALDETAEEWPEDQIDEPLSDANRAAIEAEVADLDGFVKLATSIDHNAKGKALVEALAVAFSKAIELGAAQRAIIFTESRKTQSYLLRVLAESPFKDGIVLFNGSNTDDDSKQIYATWLERHQGTDRITGSKTADMRSALVDYFREEGRIMIATEAGAEGINLQFCSLVVNYDLPWNPQRIEQRIGRCHRYGQRHDVVVVNFLNRKNEADRRVYQILSEKFKLFKDVFGASDEVLGAIESGVDFEKRIAAIYHGCRTPDQIKKAFDELQDELKPEINETMTRARGKLFENFDHEVREKLRVCDEDSKAYLDRYERLLIQLTRHELGGHAEFINDSSFRLKSCPFPSATSEVPLGLYELPRRSSEAHLYRLHHPLAEAVVAHAKGRELPVQELCFDYDGRDGRVSIVEQLLGESGWLKLSLLSVQALDQTEDHLIFTAVTRAGKIIGGEQAARLFLLPARAAPSPATPPRAANLLESLQKAAQATRLEGISARNLKFFKAEVTKLDRWADDQITASDRPLKEIRKRLRELRTGAGKTTDLAELARIQDEIAVAERRQHKLRDEISEAEDRIESQRDQLVAAIRGKLDSVIHEETLFSIRWSLHGQPHKSSSDAA
ncbi:MAG: SNF2-related protein [Terriglobia bacterium]